MRIVNYFPLFILFLFSCQNNKSNETSNELPSNSIFQLTSEWQNQNGDTLHLKDLQGKTLVVVMIYTTCKSACPILVSKMKLIESQISRKDIDKVSLVLVSIDPETDTPEFLKKFAKKNGMEGNQWVFLRSNEMATQEFANVLSMKYKRISPIDFSHSNIISIFSPNGQLVEQEEGLEINVENVVKKVSKVVNSPK
ncbi:MAG: SCO family protein [Chitinophagales bacterium]|nr:SCO family protein [Chitinophagales bacterium]MCZ2393789.1 SCO family protein [Chitinophagales bacterium]